MVDSSDIAGMLAPHSSDHLCLLHIHFIAHMRQEFTMWDTIPLDLLLNILSFLSPDAIACARSTCRHWNACDHNELRIYPSLSNHLPRAWFVAWPARGNRSCYYVHNPVLRRWYQLPLHFLSFPVRPIASVGGFILSRITSISSLQLNVCNPFAKKIRILPFLNLKRTNPAVGVVSCFSGTKTHFQVYVAGGMTDAPLKGVNYEATWELYDSEEDKWKIVGEMPVEFAVRLTVWTSNNSVQCNGALFWITSARAYSVISLQIDSNKWQEMSVPMADKLEFAALVARDGGLTLVGGVRGWRACVWKLNKGDEWELIDMVPRELGIKLVGKKESWCKVKCAGINGTFYLYRDIGTGMIVWRETEQKRHGWCWVEGCSIQGALVQNVIMKGVILQPSLLHPT